MSYSPSLHVFLTADAIGGVWQYALTLSEELGKAGHRVTLAVLGPEVSSEQRRQARLVEGLTLVETGLPLDWLSDDAEPVIRAAGQLAELAAKSGADIVHCNSPAFAGAASFSVPLVAVVHGCVATWWKASRQKPLPCEFYWHARLMREGLRSADAVVAPSASFSQAVKQTYRLPVAPIVVHNGRALVKTAYSRAQVDAALLVGRLWDEAKNAALLDRAAARLPLPFWAAGSVTGPHGEVFNPAHLEVLGHLREPALRKVLARRPVFVSAACFEPFGLAVLEAAMVGCALVLSDIPAFRELWDGAALFVPEDDEKAYAEAIGGLIDDPVRRDALGKAAKERSTRYTAEATAAAMIRIYNRILAARVEAA